jgi:hypothetical protein
MPALSLSIFVSVVFSARLQLSLSRLHRFQIYSLHVYNSLVRLRLANVCNFFVEPRADLVRCMPSTLRLDCSFILSATLRIRLNAILNRFHVSFFFCDLIVIAVPE